MLPTSLPTFFMSCGVSHARDVETRGRGFQPRQKEGRLESDYYLAAIRGGDGLKLTCRNEDEK